MSLNYISTSLVYMKFEFIFEVRFPIGHEMRWGDCQTVLTAKMKWFSPFLPPDLTIQTIYSFVITHFFSVILLILFIGNLLLFWGHAYAEQVVNWAMILNP